MQSLCLWKEIEETTRGETENKTVAESLFEDPE